MGSCMSESPLDPHLNGSRPNYNPIKKIIREYSIQKLRERWDSQQLKQVENKIISFDRKQITFHDFARIFPKMTIFSPKTQAKIYELFAYDGNKALSKRELMESLTLIRKVSQNSDFAPFIFYIYSQDPKHQLMTKAQLDEFQSQNKSFHIEELLSDGQEESIRDIDNMSGKNAQSINFNTKDREITKKRKVMHLEQFKVCFQKYNLGLYQQVFGWDLLSEEKELVSKLSKDGIVRKNGDKVFVLEYQWFLQWKAYAQRKYKVQIQIKESEVSELNYASNISKRRSRGSVQIYESIKLEKPAQKIRESIKIEKPGQIKNYILKSGKNDNQLVENLIELNNYICVPEEVWNKLVTIYHGGPAIQRIYPQIYYNTILQVEMGQDGKFLPKKTVKYTNKDKSTVGEFQRSAEIDFLCYYKYPGKYNWTRLNNLTAESKDIFNCPRTYLVFVPPNVAEYFQQNYNIHENKKGQRYLRKRLQNYGAQINVSIEGVLTKAQVVQIGQQEEIIIEFIGQNGRIIKQTIKIDDKLKNLNPENLSSENQLNQLSGLTNIGNTCYMNAVLQCLIRTPSFGGYLQKQNFADKKEGEELVLEEISKIYLQSKSNSHDIVSTKSFKRIFDKHCPFFEGNSQHDAQQFLICFLSRISEEIKSKRTEYGLRESKLKEEEEKQTVNKKVVKFFSGQTEAVTECLKCHTKGVRKEPFFTYSLSLPDPDVEYTYFLIENHISIKSTVPVRHGITLHRKVTIEQFIKAICQQHKKKEDSIAMYTVFNNEILNRLEPYSFQKEIGHHLNFNTRLVCYQLNHTGNPSYENFRNHQFSKCSIKIELRQRIYSEKTSEYKVIYLPYLLEIDQHMFWKDVKSAIDSIISKLKPKEVELDERQLLEATPVGRSDIHNTVVRQSQIVIQEELQNHKQRLSRIPDNSRQGQKKFGVKESFSLNPNLLSKDKDNSIQNYKIRVIKSDHYKQNFCVFCKEQFVLNRHSRSARTCKGCGFDEQIELFKSANFRNIYDNIIIAIDWQVSIPDFQPFVNDPSYELSEARTLGRHQKLEDLLIQNFNIKETLELRCEKETCKYGYAQRYERILVAPNILLLHFKRFTYEDNMLFKLTNNVHYPLQLTLPNSKERYQLYGAVAHIGSGVGGHYISYVRVMQRWYKCDDSRVTLAAEGQEIDCNAYLLFYKRVDFEPSLTCLSF